MILKSLQQLSPAASAAKPFLYTQKSRRIKEKKEKRKNLPFLKKVRASLAKEQIKI
jgi:hypothetical protein